MQSRKASWRVFGPIVVALLIVIGLFWWLSSGQDSATESFERNTFEEPPLQRTGPRLGPAGSP